MEDIFNSNDLTTASNTSEASDFTGAVWQTQDGGFVTSSLKVAEYFGKEHRHVMDVIREKRSAENSAHLWFADSTYKDSYGRDQKQVLMNQNGFMYIVMGFTGAKADEIKIGYINEFERMRTLKAPQIDYFSPEFVTGALKAIQQYQVENAQLKTKIETDAPATELGYTYLFDANLTSTADIAREVGNPKITQQGIHKMLLEQELIEKGGRGYEKRYKRGHKFVDSILVQKESVKNGLHFTSILATEKGKGWIISEMKKLVS